MLALQAYFILYRLCRITIRPTHGSKWRQPIVMEYFRPNAVNFTKCVVDVPAPIVNETHVALQVDLDQSVLTLDRRLVHDELTSEDRADLFHHFIRALLKVAITNDIGPTPK